MPCECCLAAREAPAHRMFSPACLWCGARLIQSLAGLRNAHNRREEIGERRRAVLSGWMAYGHDETELRRLAKGPRPLEPEPAASSSEPRKAGRRR